jgi:hypothetical protein
VLNISAGGVLLSLAKKMPIMGASLDDSLQDIVVHIAAKADEPSGQNEPITVRKGRIVRETFDSQRNTLLLAVELFPNSKEEKALFEYVRWRELEILRKGIKD